MNRLATFARVAGVVTVSMFVALITRTPEAQRESALADTAATHAAPNAAQSYLPAQYVNEERAAHSSELPAQF